MEKMTTTIYTKIGETIKRILKREKICVKKTNCSFLKMNEGVVSKETVVLRRWGSSIQRSKYGGQFTLSTPLIKPNFCSFLKEWSID